MEARLDSAENLLRNESLSSRISEARDVVKRIVEIRKAFENNQMSWSRLSNVPRFDREQVGRYYTDWKRLHEDFNNTALEMSRLAAQEVAIISDFSDSFLYFLRDDEATIEQKQEQLNRFRYELFSAGSRDTLGTGRGAMYAPLEKINRLRTDVLYLEFSMRSNDIFDKRDLSQEMKIFEAKVKELEEEVANIEIGRQGSPSLSKTDLRLLPTGISFQEDERRKLMQNVREHKKTLKQKMDERIGKNDKTWRDHLETCEKQTACISDHLRAVSIVWKALFADVVELDMRLQLVTSRASHQTIFQRRLEPLIDVYKRLREVLWELAHEQPSDIPDIIFHSPAASVRSLRSDHSGVGGFGKIPELQTGTGTSQTDGDDPPVSKHSTSSHTPSMRSTKSSRSDAASTDADRPDHSNGTPDTGNAPSPAVSNDNERGPSSNGSNVDIPYSEQPQPPLPHVETDKPMEEERSGGTKHSTSGHTPSRRSTKSSRSGATPSDAVRPDHSNGTPDTGNAPSPAASNDNERSPSPSRSNVDIPYSEQPQPPLPHAETDKPLEEKCSSGTKHSTSGHTTSRRTTKSSQSGAAPTDVDRLDRSNDMPDTHSAVDSVAAADNDHETYAQGLKEHHHNSLEKARQLPERIKTIGASFRTVQARWKSPPPGSDKVLISQYYTTWSELGETFEKIVLRINFIVSHSARRIHDFANNFCGFIGSKGDSSMEIKLRQLAEFRALLYVESSRLFGPNSENMYALAREIFVLRKDVQKFSFDISITDFSGKEKLTEEIESLEDQLRGMKLAGICIEPNKVNPVGSRVEVGIVTVLGLFWGKREVLEKFVEALSSESANAHRLEEDIARKRKVATQRENAWGEHTERCSEEIEQISEQLAAISVVWNALCADTVELETQLRIVTEKGMHEDLFNRRVAATQELYKFLYDLLWAITHAEVPSDDTMHSASDPGSGIFKKASEKISSFFGGLLRKARSCTN